MHTLASRTEVYRDEVCHILWEAVLKMPVLPRNMVDMAKRHVLPPTLRDPPSSPILRTKTPVTTSGR